MNHSQGFIYFIQRGDTVLPAALLPLLDFSILETKPEREVIQSRTEILKEKTLDTVEVPDEVRERILAELESSTRFLRDFILYEIGPISLALESAIEEARQTLQVATDTEELTFVNVNKFISRFSQALLVKMVIQVGIHLDIPKYFIRKLVEATLDTQGPHGSNNQ